MSQPSAMKNQLNKREAIVAHDDGSEAFTRLWHREFDRVAAEIRPQYASAMASAHRLQKVWVWCRRELEIRFRLTQRLIRRLY